VAIRIASTTPRRAGIRGSGRERTGGRHRETQYSDKVSHVQRSRVRTTNGRVSAIFFPDLPRPAQHGVPYAFRFAHLLRARCHSARCSSLRFVPMNPAGGANA